MKRILTPWLLIIPFFTLGQTTKFPPMDESGKTSELKSFVVELKETIESRDGQKLLELIHPQIKFDFDEGIGKEKFRAKWNPESKNSEIWPIMDRIVGLGGVFTKDGANPFFDFVFPYVNEVDLEDADQYFNTLVITGKDVNVRERPNLASKVVGRLTYDIVTYDYEKSQIGNWYFVQTTDKSIRGYVSADLAYSPVDYRMFLTKEAGTWMISCLVAGD